MRCASQIRPIQKVVAKIAVVAAQIQGLRLTELALGRNGAFATGCIERFLAFGAPSFATHPMTTIPRTRKIARK